MKDARGHDLAIGSTVAYNRSGDVVHGVIERFGQPRRVSGAVRSGPYCGLPVHMRRSPIFIRNTGTNKLSRVVRVESVMAIFEQPVWVCCCGAANGVNLATCRVCGARSQS